MDKLQKGGKEQSRTKAERERGREGVRKKERGKV